MKIFIFLCFALSFMDQCLCEDLINIKAEPEQNINLTCRADRNSKVSAVILTRDDLEPEYVFLYRDEQINVDYQNPQFKNRTKLLSFTSTDGKVNLSINNVTENDSGEYKCRVKTEIRSSTRRKRAVSESSTIIHLHVDPPPAPPGRGHIGHIGLVAGLMVVVLVVLAVLAGIVWKKRRNVSPPQDEAAETLQA